MMEELAFLKWQRFILWTPCSLVCGYQVFEETDHLFLQAQEDAVPKAGTLRYSEKVVCY